MNITHNHKYLNRYKDRDLKIYKDFIKLTPVLKMQIKYRMTAANIYRIVKEVEAGKYE